MQLDEAARALYAGPPSDFVDQRDALAREAKAAGDRDLAAALTALRKPTTGAWLANLLAREQIGQLQQLVDLGAALRDAQDDLDPDQLRQLGRQRHQVVSALVGLARRRAAELGVRTGEAAAQELEETLTAALADPEAASAVLSGTLSHGLEYAGLGFGEASATARPRPAAAPAPAKPRAVAMPDGPTAAEREREERIDAAERALAEARLRAAHAQSAADEAEAAQRDAEQAVEAADEMVGRLTDQLAEAKEALAAAKQRLATARRAGAAAAREATGEASKADRAAKSLADMRAR